MTPEQFAARLRDSDHVRQLLRLAIEEDVGSGDATTDALVPPELRASARVLAKAEGVVCGLELVELLREVAAADFRVLEHLPEGSAVAPGDLVLRLEGRAAHLVTCERLLLNILQRLGGIATITRDYVRAVAGTGCRVLETRKTVPGWRLLDKYAVLAGGGTLHRLGLFDQILAKENHFALARRAGLAASFGGVLEALLARRPEGMVVEVEVETLDELDAALRAGIDIVLLDDMSLEDMEEAVRRRDAAPLSARGERPLLEASGGITLGTVRAVAETGVDRVSIGALTHSVPALDLSLLID